MNPSRRRRLAEGRCLSTTIRAVALMALAALLASPGSSLAAADQPDRPDRPNIVLIVADDLGYGEVGPDGEPTGAEVPTPHIDSIAANGVRFTAGYVTASYCSPSRAGLLTGRYQSRFGYGNNAVGAKNEQPGVGLPRSERTLAEHLKNAGYATALIGKWHLGGTAPYHPQRHGFDYFFGFLHEGHFFAPYPYDGMLTWLRRKTLPDGSRQGRWRDGDTILSAHMGYNEPDYNADNPIYRNGQPVDERAYLTDAWTREATDFIQRHRDRPFFLYLPHNAVHSPLQAPKSITQQFSEIDDVQRRIFAAMLKRLDHSVGRVLAKLRELDLEDDTLVIFLSDNGGPTRELTSSNKPLRAGKGTMYEGGLRVPFMMQWPGRIPAGRVEQRPVIALDLYPTAAAAADAEPLNPRKLDGINLLPHVTGDEPLPAARTFYWRMGGKRALRRGDWKIVHHPRRNKKNEWELYNLDEDLAEQRDLSTARPEKLRSLTDRWRTLNKQMP